MYKNLGFDFTDNKGKILRIDDPRIDPIWKKFGELGLPVLIHTADPKSFWDPMDGHNEWWLEMET